MLRMLDDVAPSPRVCQGSQYLSNLDQGVVGGPRHTPKTSVPPFSILLTAQNQHPKRRGWGEAYPPPLPLPFWHSTYGLLAQNR